MIDKVWLIKKVEMRFKEDLKNVYVMCNRLYEVKSRVYIINEKNINIQWKVLKDFFTIIISIISY